MVPGQSSHTPFYCSRCGRLYIHADALVACLKRHEAADEAMLGEQGWAPESRA